MQKIAKINLMCLLNEMINSGLFETYNFSFKYILRLCQNDSGSNNKYEKKNRKL